MTITWNQRDTARAVGWPTASLSETALEQATATEAQITITLPQGGATRTFAFTGPTGEPNDASWPTGTWDWGIDVNAIESDVSITKLQFARVSSDGNTEEERNEEDITDITTTGLHSGTTASFSWTAGSSADRVGFQVLATNAHDHMDEDLTLDVNTSNTFVTGPFVVTSDETLVHEAGIASGVAFGETTVIGPDQNLDATGFAETSAFGSHAIAETQHLDTTGIASEEAFGSHSISESAQLAPTGLASEEAFGSHAISESAELDLTGAGIASGEAFGSHVIAEIIQLDLDGAGIASEEAFGSHSISEEAFLVPTGLASEEAFGTHGISGDAAEQSLDLAGAGLASEEVFGLHAIAETQHLDTTGIASGEAFGNQVISEHAHLVCTGIASEEAFGSQAISEEAFLDLDTAGIASGEAFGQHQLTVYLIHEAGIASGEAFGSHSLSEEAFLVCTGLASEVAFGAHDISGGEAVAEVFGRGSVNYGKSVSNQYHLHSSQQQGAGAKTTRARELRRA